MTALIDGKYQVLEKLREGGMGAIYKVRHVLLDEVRVVKTMRPQIEGDQESRQRFYNEAKMATTLKHPNIASCFDFIEDGQTFYMVMEFIDGINLGDLIAKGPRPSIPVLLDIGAQTLDALSYLHKKKLVHRDVSPDNIMLVREADGTYTVKLIDLGVAKNTEAEGVTVTGIFVGKLKYCSPEQLGVLRDGQVIDGRSDVYSMGCVLYQALTGQPPFQSSTQQGYIMAHLAHPPMSFEDSDPRGNVPPNVRALVTRALAKNRDERWPTAADFAEALREARRWILANPPIAFPEGDLEKSETVILARPGTQTGPRPVSGTRSAELARQASPRTAVVAKGAESADPVDLPVGADPPTVLVAPSTPGGRPRPATQTGFSTTLPKTTAGAATSQKGRILAIAGIAAALVAGVVAVLIARRGGPSESEARLGTVIVTASPWGEIVAIEDVLQRRGVPFPPTTTPARIRLAPGLYKLTLRGGGSRSSVQAAVIQEVSAFTEHSLNVPLPGFDLDKAVATYLPEPNDSAQAPDAK